MAQAARRRAPGLPCAQASRWSNHRAGSLNSPPLRLGLAPFSPSGRTGACSAPQVRGGRRASRPIGRVLCARLRGPAVIHLGLPLPAASCGLPASIGRAALNRSRRPAPLTANTGPLDLAPGGVYRAAAVTCGAGGLLHHRFTLTFCAFPMACANGGLFSVALSRGSPRVDVIDHPALRSPDLPRRRLEPRQAPRPPGQLARCFLKDRR